MLAFSLFLLGWAHGITLTTLSYYLSAKGKIKGKLESEKEDTFMGFDLDS